MLEIRWRLRISDAEPSSDFKHKLSTKSRLLLCHRKWYLTKNNFRIRCVSPYGDGDVEKSYMYVGVKLIFVFCALHVSGRENIQLNGWGRCNAFFCNALSYWWRFWSSETIYRKRTPVYEQTFVAMENLPAFFFLTSTTLLQLSWLAKTCIQTKRNNKHSVWFF